MKNSYKDNELFKTTPEYAIVNQCWSMKRFSYYFSPDGERFEAPSGFSRTNNGWRSHGVDGRVIYFFDKKYGSYHLSYDAAIAHHTATAPLMQGRRQRMILEKCHKTTHVGIAGLYVYPPKDPNRPLSGKNRWRIFTSPVGTIKKAFSFPWNKTPGDSEFDTALTAAAKYCKDVRDTHFSTNSFKQKETGADN